MNKIKIPTTASFVTRERDISYNPWQAELCAFYGYDWRVSYFIDYAWKSFEGGAMRANAERKPELYKGELELMMDNDSVRSLTGVEELSDRTITKIRKSVRGGKFFKWRHQYGHKSPILITINAQQLFDYLKGSNHGVASTGEEQIVKLSSPKKAAAVTPKEETAVAPKEEAAVTPKEETAVAPKEEAAVAPKEEAATPAATMDTEMLAFEIKDLLKDRKLDKALRDAIEATNVPREEFLKSYYDFVINDMESNFNLTASFVKKGFEIHAKFLKENGNKKAAKMKRQEYPAIAEKYVVFMRRYANGKTVHGAPYNGREDVPWADKYFENEVIFITEALKRKLIDEDFLRDLMRLGAYGYFNKKPAGTGLQYLYVPIFSLQLDPKDIYHEQIKNKIRKVKEKIADIKKSWYIESFYTLEEKNNFINEWKKNYEKARNESSSTRT